jgi:hypothetical protein
MTLFLHSKIIDILGAMKKYILAPLHISVFILMKKKIVKFFIFFYMGDFVKKWHFSLSVANSNPKHKILNFGPHSL